MEWNLSIASFRLNFTGQQSTIQTTERVSPFKSSWNLERENGSVSLKQGGRTGWPHFMQWCLSRTISVNPPFEKTAMESNDCDYFGNFQWAVGQWRKHKFIISFRVRMFLVTEYVVWISHMWSFFPGSPQYSGEMSTKVIILNILKKSLSVPFPPHLVSSSVVPFCMWGAF